jgi:hypothetical protein
MADAACSFCGSDLGFYDGPNGKPRCLNCYGEEAGTPSKEEAATPEPNRPVEGTVEVSDQIKQEAQDKAQAGPASTRGAATAEDSEDVQDKMVRSPSRKARAKGTAGTA